MGSPTDLQPFGFGVWKTVRINARNKTKTFMTHCVRNHTSRIYPKKIIQEKERSYVPKISIPIMHNGEEMG